MKQNPSPIKLKPQSWRLSLWRKSGRRSEIRGQWRERRLSLWRKSGRRPKIRDQQIRRTTSWPLAIYLSSYINPSQIKPNASQIKPNQTKPKLNEAKPKPNPTHNETKLNEAKPKPNPAKHQPNQATNAITKTISLAKIWPAVRNPWPVAERRLSLWRNSGRRPKIRDQQIRRTTSLRVKSKPNQAEPEPNQTKWSQTKAASNQTRVWLIRNQLTQLINQSA